MKRRWRNRAFLGYTAFAVLAIVSSITFAESPDRLTELAKRMSDPGSAPMQPEVDTPLGAAAPKAPALSTPYTAPDGLEADEETPLYESANEALPLGQSSDPMDLPDADSQTSPNSGWVLNTFSALLLVLMLIWGVRALLMKATGRTPATSRSTAVEVLSRVTVAPRSHVMLLKIGSKVMVVGESSAGLQPLGEVNDPAEVSQILTSVEASKSTSISEGFSQLLNRAETDYDEDGDVFETGGDNEEYAVDRARDRISSLMGKLRNITKGANA